MISNLNMISRATRTENRSREASGWGGREKCPLGVPLGSAGPIGSALRVAAGHYPGESLNTFTFAPVLCEPKSGDTERIGGSRPGSYGPPLTLPTPPPREGLSGSRPPSWDQVTPGSLFPASPRYPWLVPGSHWWVRRPAFCQAK